jgi:peptidoglycan/LPS O-acetylase OafA/YrhL
MQRLLSIDCLRGLAALGVVFHHASQVHSAGFPAGHPVTILEEVLNLGFAGVWLFFVISGFCIHLGQARAVAEGRPRKPIDFAGFWKRRIIRLYPAYLVCLVVYLALNLRTGALKADESLVWNFLLHVLMLHNIERTAAYGFCGAFWTLALEEQLYLAYFLLLALRHRLGWRWTLLICLGSRVAIYAVHWLAEQSFGIDVPIKESTAAQWFVWALGALAVEAYAGLIVLPRWCRDLRAAAGLLGVGAVFVTFVRHFPVSPLCKPIWFVLDPVLGLGFFVILNWFVAVESTWPLRRLAPWLVRRLARIGLFSYSLYLTHEIVMTHFSVSLARWCGLERGALFLLSLTPLCLALAWVFYQLFERPFMHGGARLRSPVAQIIPEPQGLPATPV